MTLFYTEQQAILACKMKSAQRVPIMMLGVLVLPLTIVGMEEMSLALRITRCRNGTPAYYWRPRVVLDTDHFQFVEQQARYMHAGHDFQ